MRESESTRVNQTRERESKAKVEKEKNAMLEMFQM